MKSTALVVVVGAMLAAAGLSVNAAWAADTAAVIKQRQALMKEQGADLGAVKGFLDGKNDQAKAEAGVADLKKTMDKIPDVFPEGSGGPNPEGKYTTKPEIWTDWKGFLAQRDVATDKTDALIDAMKGGDKAKIQTAFSDLGKNGCGGCHQKFREEIKK
jgi:cytochrome c556